jgi:hypothetical protein
MIKPEELNYTSQTFDATLFKSVKLTNVLRSLSRTNESSESIKDRAEYLNKLVGLCNYGNKFSKRIKLDFQISNEILKVNFIKMLSENEWNLLKMILYSTHPSKFEIAREFVKTYDLNMARLCDFVLEELLNTLNAFISLNKNCKNFSLCLKRVSRKFKQKKLGLDIRIFVRVSFPEFLFGFPIFPVYKLNSY